MKEFFQNKTVLILGLGVEGIDTYNYIKQEKIDCNVIVTDKKGYNSIVKESEWLEYDDFIKKNYNADIIMKSPGIVLEDIKDSLDESKVTSQAELFIKYNRDNIIAVTGTKGKSTTTSMIYEMLCNAGKKVKLCGNIGIPFFHIEQELNDETISVIELSAHQLQRVKVSPKIACFINIYEEHLDYYKTYDKYIDAKCNIFKYQGTEDVLIINRDTLEKFTNEMNYNISGKVISLSENQSDMFHMKHGDIFKENDLILSKNEKRILLGEQNTFDMMFLFAIADLYNIDYKIVKDTIASFKGLEHRLQNIGTYSGITFYDDCISTIPETCIAGIEAINNIETIIIGGMDRGIDYGKLINYIKNKNDINVILTYNSGKKIYDQVSNLDNCYYEYDLEKAVKKAFEVTSAGKACLLSPAAASYDSFDNYKHKGKMYKKYIEDYENNVSK